MKLHIVYNVTNTSQYKGVNQPTHSLPKNEVSKTMEQLVLSFHAILQDLIYSNDQ